MHKSDTEAAKYRTLGNEYFGKRNFDAALEAYGNSILYAPASSDSMAYAYGNRSAVLFESDAFSECLRDIKRALFCRSCPAALKEKLERRKSKCEAEEDCQEIARLALAKAERDSVPALFSGSNPKIPSVSAKVTMEYNAQTGRRLMALEDVEAGSVVIVEKPYTSVLLEHTRSSHCHYCHEILPLDFVPCSTCIDVRFCSESCVDAEGSAHALECGQVGRLHQIGLGYLAYKIFTVTPVETLADYFRCPHRSSSPAFDGVYGLNSGETYDCSYHCVWNLMAHNEDAKKADLEIYEKTARSLAQLATSRRRSPDMMAVLFQEASSICSECKFAPDQRKLELARDYLTKVFVRLIEILICNAHAINAMTRETEMDAATGRSIEKTEEWKIASAIYSTASLMNHSCKPNIFSSFIGKTLIVRTTRNILAGEELLNCYGPQFGRMLTLARKEALEQQYYFDCTCCACSDPDYAKREAYFTAAACPNCPDSTWTMPPMLFYRSSKSAYRNAGLPNAMFEDANGHNFKCSKCGRLISANVVEESVKKAEERLTTLVEGTKVPSSLCRVLNELDVMLYVHNKKLSKWRDTVAEWLLKQDSVAGILHAVALMELNLHTVGFTFGEESIELANELIKYLGVVQAVLQPEDMERVKPHLHVLMEKAKRIFGIYYGPDCMQIEQLGTLTSS